MSASSPGTGSLDLEKRVGELEKSNIGYRYILTENIEYICPSDGYFLISNSGSANSILSGYINGTEFIKISNPANGELSSYQNFSIFVRKGMRIKFVGSGGYFYPII